MLKLDEGNGKKKKVSIEEDEDGHGNDPALKRTGKMFGGLMMDIRRRLPWYVSDYTDALNLQCIATFCFMYFALLAPIVTFGGLLEEATHQRMVRVLGYIPNGPPGQMVTKIFEKFSKNYFENLDKLGPGCLFGSR